jgi:polygalacturonase
VRGGHRYLVGTLQLKSNIDFHLADDAELLISINRADYSGEAAVVARDAQGLRISGSGTINGRSPEIMTKYDAANEWYSPAPAWRPRLVLLTGCTDLEIRGITMKQAPLWTLHMVGCKRVVVDGIKIRNQLDVPNCDGIDPDHCQDLEIRNCDIACGDDAIVIKSTRDGSRYGASSGIVVRDCILETQDSGLKIGTETVQDIHDVLFERCVVKSGCRGLTIQLRDEGNIYNVVFRDIRFKAQYYSAPWWGRGEAISLTAIPRSLGAPVGIIRDVRIENVTGMAENSVRICGSAQSRVRDVSLENVAITLDRWTRYPGGMFDNRPTRAQTDLVPHDTPGYCLEHADRVALKNCSVAWGKNIPEYFSNALQAHDVTDLSRTNFQGQSAHPERIPAVAIS